MRPSESNSKRVFLENDLRLFFTCQMFSKFFSLVFLLASRDSILLDIERDMESVTGREKQFYIDQITTRHCCISEEIDEEYEKKRGRISREDQQEERDKLQEAFISQEEENISILNSTFDENTLNTSLNQSGRVRSTKKSSDISTQTDHKFNAPKIRINSKVCTDQVKSTCARFLESAKSLLKLPG